MNHALDLFPLSIKAVYTSSYYVHLDR